MLDPQQRLVTRTTRTWGAASSQGPEKYFVREQTSGGAESTAYFDSLERPVKTEAKAFDGTLATSTIGYDDRGRRVEAWRPVAGSGGGTSSRRTVTSYDVLDRPVLERTYDDAGFPLATTATSYWIGAEFDAGLGAYANRPSVTVTRSKTGECNPGPCRASARMSNSQGQVLTAIDAAGNASRLGYDASGNMVSFTGPGTGAPTATFGYDLRGRRTAMADPDMGSWSFEYNGAGDLIRQTDARGQVTRLETDALGRVRSRKEHYGSESADARLSTWFYDGCLAGSGRLCSASSGHWFAATGSYQEQFAREIAYDGAGRARRSASPSLLGIGD